MAKVIGVIFEKNNECGDFNWMIKQHEYNDSLFIFNDNIEWHKLSFSSGGNACVRNYNKYGEYKNYPQSAGISTGTFKDMGFKKLTPEVKEIIDNEINEIIELIKIHKYKRIFYSQDKLIKTPKIGTKIFVVTDDVLDYILMKIYELEKI